jgi:histidine ammonia-lyase
MYCPVVLMMEVAIDGETLTIEKVHMVAREHAKVIIPENVKKRVEANAQTVQKLVDAGEALYGVTTGIGEFARIKISKEQAEELQNRIVYSHAAGTGNIATEDHVRGAMLLRANVMAKGYTGVRLSTLETVVGMLNKNVVPVIYEKGSVGTSGDLSPMSQFAEVVMGEGEAFYDGKRMKGKEALDAAGLKPVKLTYKEGLGLINGSQMFTALGALVLYDAERVFKTAQVASAMTIDVLRSVLKAFDPRLHAVRPFVGQNAVAENVRRLIDGSEILAQKSGKVQDGYSLRCTAQVLGPTRDAFEYVRKQLEIEMNSAADNPLFFTDGCVCLTGGNFHGQPISIALDLLGIVMSNVGNLSVAHINRLLNPVLSGLPDFLVEGKGLNSGLMVAHYTAGALVSENKILAHPASVDTLSLSADQEDHVSMGPGAAFKARQILENITTVISIELMCGAQAIGFRKPLKPGKGTEAAYIEIRKVVTQLVDDRVLYPDIAAVRKIVWDGTILGAVEKNIGPLK